jgi:hypothetical protein
LRAKRQAIFLGAIEPRAARVKNLDMTIVEITGCMLRAARSLTGLSQQETRRPRFDLAPLPDGLGTRADAEPRSDHFDDEPATIGRQANDDHPRMTQMSMA